eukprot:2508306-Pyramimonas_sp.AAC.1
MTSAPKAGRIASQSVSSLCFTHLAAPPRVPTRCRQSLSLMLFASSMMDVIMPNVLSASSGRPSWSWRRKVPHRPWSSRARAPAHHPPPSA